MCQRLYNIHIKNVRRVCQLLLSSIVHSRWSLSVYFDLCIKQLTLYVLNAECALGDQPRLIRKEFLSPTKINIKQNDLRKNSKSLTK